MVKRILLYMFTDCKRIFDIIIISKLLEETLFMNDVADFCNAYKENETTNIANNFSSQGKPNPFQDNANRQAQVRHGKWIC